MTFANGNQFTTSSGDWNRKRTGANGTSSFAYGTEITPTITTLNYYLNDSLVHTGTTDISLPLYPLINSYETDRDVTINADYTTTNRIDFTINEYGSAPSNSGWGLNYATALIGWQDLNACFSFDTVAGNSQYWIREEGSTVSTPTSFTPSDGDVWSLRWPVTSGGPLLPPPPAYVRL